MKGDHIDVVLAHPVDALLRAVGIEGVVFAVRVQRQPLRACGIASAGHSAGDARDAARAYTIEFDEDGLEDGQARAHECGGALGCSHDDIHVIVVCRVPYHSAADEEESGAADGDTSCTEVYGQRDWSK